MGLLAVRLMTAALPEEVILDKAIDSLIEYREALKNAPEETVNRPSGFSGLLAKIKGSSDEKEITPTIIEPRAELSALIMKWEDKGKSPDQIISESNMFDKKLRDSGLLDDE